MSAPNRVKITKNTSNAVGFSEAPSEEGPMRWRIYYNDGVFVSSKDCEWEAAPQGNIVAIVHAKGNRPASCELGTPYYWKFNDWIARVWDPTLYMRQTGKVKFGRWAEREMFGSAWREAVLSLTPGCDPAKVLTDETLRSGVAFTNRVAEHGAPEVAWKLYYDNGSFITSEHASWDEAPTDGVLCATYQCLYSGALFSCALRRYTYYYWKGHQLLNSDDLHEVLKTFTQCKRGLTQFEGKSYLHQAEALAAALADDLEDLR